jgi:hypothetical protein
MPLVGLKSEDGVTRVRWENLDLTRDLSAFYPADPALLAFIAEQSQTRSELNPREVSASQLETGIRQLYLQGSREYYVTVDSQIASIMGTMKHSMVNIDRPGFLTELRLFWRHGSAQCDTYFVPKRLLVDLKNIKWYSIKKILENGVMREKKGYVYQLNLFRVLMQMPDNWNIIKDTYPSITKEELRVERMQITCIPPDLDYKNKKEARRLVANPAIIPIEIPILPDDQVLSAYTKKAEALGKAFDEGYAPLCTPEERWERSESGAPVKCLSYCPVSEACIALSEARGEKHPIIEYRNRLAA